jgi:hypothetical protein
MSDRLWNILNFTSIPIGGSATLPHLLVVNGDPIIPDFVTPPALFGFVSGDATNVTVKNTGSLTGNCSVLVSAIHPVARSFGLSPDDGTFQQGLTPRPFSLSTGGTPQPPFPNPPIAVSIFARLTGNDTTGDGTLATPYRTFQRAILDVPSIIPAGVRYVVDITGIGLEVLPPNYQFPPIITAQTVTLDLSDPDFITIEGLDVIARPQPMAGIPLADTLIAPADVLSVVTDPSDLMVTVTLNAPRASWAANALRGKLLAGAVPIVDNGTIIASTTTTLLVTPSVSMLAPSAPWQVKEPSATLQGSGTDAITVVVGSPGIKGIKFVNTGGAGTALAINFMDCGTPLLESCDIEGLGSHGASTIVLVTSFIHGKNLGANTSLLAQSSLFSGIPSFTEIGDFPANWVLAGDAFVSCPVIGPRADPFGLFASPVGARPVGMTLNGVFITTPVVDGAFPADGVYVCGGYTALANVRINGAPGSAIRVDTANGMCSLTTVVGGTGGGGDPANAGFGVLVNDGAQVRVLDNGTLVTGTGGDMKVGTLPARTWADFRGLVPTKNQYDLQTPFVVNVASGLATPGGDDVAGAGTGGCSGSRLFQRP